MFVYTVRCRFVEANQSLVQSWLDWLTSTHIEDVLNAGAVSAAIVKMETAEPIYEIRYRFESKEVFDRYESESAPALRAEGLERFPLELGLAYERTTGSILAEFGG